MRTINEHNQLFDKFKEKHNIYSNKLHSDTWSRGGCHNNCWGDSYPVYADREPSFHYSSFSKFNSLINDVFYSISDREKDDLFRLSVDIDSYVNRDYYGGSERVARFECDVERLFELLDEKGYIDEDHYNSEDEQ
ncbi:hypothetical protein D3C81_997800 [compost metagenome]